MPRGDNPNSRANLKVIRSEKEAREKGKKGGIASGESRAFYKSLNETLREQCTPEDMIEMNRKVIAMAKRGNLRAYELIRDGLGEKPGEKIELNNAVLNPLQGLTEEELRKLAGETDDS